MDSFMKLANDGGCGNDNAAQEEPELAGKTGGPDGLLVGVATRYPTIGDVPVALFMGGWMGDGSRPEFPKFPDDDLKPMIHINAAAFEKLRDLVEWKDYKPAPEASKAETRVWTVAYGAQFQLDQIKNKIELAMGEDWMTEGRRALSTVDLFEEYRKYLFQRSHDGFKDQGFGCSC